MPAQQIIIHIRPAGEKLPAVPGIFISDCLQKTGEVETGRYDDKWLISD